jgi:hypothetical protein
MRASPILVSLAAVMFAACSPMILDGGSASAASCTAKDNVADCSILVDVSLNADGTKCSVAVLSSQTTVGFKKNAKEKKIEWEFTSSSPAGSRFAANGIAPKSTPSTNPANWNNNFKNGGASHGGRQFNWKNDNDPGQAGTDYFYLVSVEVPGPGGTSLSCKQDPVIKNQA